jgi:hypothetical protein
LEEGTKVRRCWDLPHPLRFCDSLHPSQTAKPICNTPEQECNMLGEDSQQNEVVRRRMGVAFSHICFG